MKLHDAICGEELYMMKWKRIICLIFTIICLSESLIVSAEGNYMVYDKELTDEQYKQFNIDLDNAQTADEVQAVFDKYGINQNVNSLINGETPQSNSESKTESYNNSADENQAEDSQKEIIVDESKPKTEDESFAEETTTENISVEGIGGISGEEADVSTNYETLVIEDDINYTAIIIGISITLMIFSAVLLILAAQRNKRK
jgi:hypothetical protein